MKNIVGAKILNNKYGEGIIKEFGNDDIMVISFPGIGEKRFKYPDSFCKSIQSEDGIIQEEAEEAWLKKLESKKAEEIAKKAAEQDKKLVHRKLSPEEIEKKTLELDTILKGIDANVEFKEKTNRIFIVHQGKTYTEEFSNGYAWAPASGIHHHERMAEIRKGDIVFNYANGAIQAISEAISNSFYSPRPSELSGFGWDYAGYRVQLRYQRLSSPVKLDSIQDSIIRLRAKMYSSFDSAGNACQGYMYELELKIAELIKSLILSSARPTGVVKVLERI